MQTTLLKPKAIQVEPLGSNQVHKPNVRVIAATSRDLSTMVAQGLFRADLYYRLHVLPIRLPRLTDRLGLTFDAVNLTRTKQQEYYRFDNVGDKDRYNLGTVLIPRTFAVGVRYSFN